MDVWMGGWVGGWVDGWMARWMDGWMTSDFTSFSIVLQSYQDDGRLIMKGNGAPFTVEKIYSLLDMLFKNMFLY